MILYLTPGCFDKGGISRYNRYQISALRQEFGDRNVKVLSVLGPKDGDFEEPFRVDWCAGGTSVDQKARYVGRTIVEAAKWRPRAVMAAHVNLGALGKVAAMLGGGKSILNVYGLEVWSGLRADARWGVRAADLVISDCHFTAKYLRDAKLRAALPTQVLWDCVDTNRFCPGPPSEVVAAKYGMPCASNAFVVLTLGRLVAGAAHKGYFRLLQVFELAVRRVPKMHLVYAGHGALAAELRSEAAARGLGDRVHFCGSVHEADMADVYRNCHVFSLVSDRGKGRGEGIPLTPLEAASCGKPIIVGNQDGSSEAVEEGVNGYVVDPFDLESHAARLVEMATNGTRYADMSAAARARVVRHHSFEEFCAMHSSHLRVIGLRAEGVTEGEKP